MVNVTWLVKYPAGNDAAAWPLGVTTSRLSFGFGWIVTWTQSWLAHWLAVAAPCSIRKTIARTPPRSSGTNCLDAHTASNSSSDETTFTSATPSLTSVGPNGGKLAFTVIR